VVDEQAGNGVVAVDVWGVVLVDDVQVWTAPPVERERVQMKAHSRWTKASESSLSRLRGRKRTAVAAPSISTLT